MTEPRATQTGSFRPTEVVLIFLAAMVLGGGFLLLSAAESTRLVDGAKPWNEESPLRAVVRLLCLNYQFPTVNQGEIKGYLLGIGAGLAVMVVGISTAVRPRTGEDESDGGGSDEKLVTRDSAAPVPGETRRQLSLLGCAQGLCLAYLLWALASSRWSSAPALSLGAATLLVIQFLWAFGIGLGLRPRSAALAARVFIVVTAMTSAVALWYFYGRNPILRAKFPYGNPNFLSAALIPGILLTLGELVSSVRSLLRQADGKSIARAASCVILLGINGWAFALAESRGPAVGLAVGVLALAYFSLSGRARAVPALAAVILGGAAWWILPSMGALPSPTGRSESLRLRGYAWEYAARMFQERPLKGHGIGAFTWKADAMSGDDILNDPPVFESRMDHAHNEWLEILAELGSVGLVLIAGGIVLSLAGAIRAGPSIPIPSDRMLLTALVASLIALVVEESFGVGLRISEVPTAFFSVVGLLWAYSGNPSGRISNRLARTSGGRAIAVMLGLILGLGVLVISQRDFSAARHSHRTEEFFQKNQFDEAIQSAMLATDRLSPQRALVNRLRLGEAYVHAAEKLGERAADRQRRARETEPPNPRLMALADEEFGAAEELCKSATAAVKELVAFSPGFLGEGALEFRINSIRARLAGARRDAESAQALWKHAAVALGRELGRQPFDPNLAAEYVRLSVDAVAPKQLWEILARPLRYHRLSEGYVDLLRSVADHAALTQALSTAVRRAYEVLKGERKSLSGDDPLDSWCPEILRLSATLRFLRGDYEDAAAELAIASTAYLLLPVAAPLGAAACHAEWADCRFFSDPSAPLQATEIAGKAVALAPDSRLGRELRDNIKQRMVHYYLAADDEEKARGLLRELAPAGVSNDILQRELGVRIRRLCESLLLQRREAEVLRKPVENLIPNMRRWLDRAADLNPDDPQVAFMAADLAFHSSDDAAAAVHLRRAMERGLDRDNALRFLTMAAERRPLTAELQALLIALQKPPAEGSSPEAP